MRRIALVIALLSVCLAPVACGPRSGESAASGFRRPFDPASRSYAAICYGPHRDGQRPGGPAPSADEIRQDLRLMVRHWDLLRLYGTAEPCETVLQVIRRDGLDMKVMLGVWIAPEQRRDADGAVVERFPEAVAANAREVAGAIRLAAAYPEIVVAVSVGNETQVDWSAHRSPLDILVGHVRTVRAGVTVPVTVADDFNFWNKPASRTLVPELDFITLHAHPMWNGLQLADALPWLAGRLAEIAAYHPGVPIVVGETGWATSVHDQGEQARLIQGRPGEAEQREFFEAAGTWADSAGVTIFYFEAFDENWKGGAHPDEVEKHWGLFRADRTPKAALAAPR